MPQSLQEVMKQGIMGVKPAQFDMQFMKAQWVTSSSYNIAADGQRLGMGRRCTACDTDTLEALVLYQKVKEHWPWDIPFDLNIFEERHVELSE
ncbi:hypothetical protein EI94DRAFT_1800971 [Lactarius quietus]|nr:hypothetical protein EI94DRAFT_1800971 [Lactarius quietus]